jgi:hypothetical protein
MCWAQEVQKLWVPKIGDRCIPYNHYRNSDKLLIAFKIISSVTRPHTICTTLNPKYDILSNYELPWLIWLPTPQQCQELSGMSWALFRLLEQKSMELPEDIYRDPVERANALSRLTSPEILALETLMMARSGLAWSCGKWRKPRK